MIRDREKYVNLEDVKITLHNTDSLGKAAWNVISLPYIVPPKWIPVTERLPEGEMPCLVSRNCKKPKLIDQVQIDFWYIPKGQTLGYWFNSSNWNVTAWMPLPEPYKEVMPNER